MVGWVPLTAQLQRSGMERSDVACTVLLDLSFPDEAYPSIRGNPLRSFMFRKIIMHSLGAPVPIVIVIYNDEPVLIYGWE